MASLLGVAGGELLIPTLILLFGADMKLAGSLSLAGEPADDAGRLRPLQPRQSFAVLGRNRRFVLVMAAGQSSAASSAARCSASFPARVLLPLLAVILLVSAVKVWLHK